MAKMVRCAYCGGSGDDRYKRTPCVACGGSGHMMVPYDKTPSAATIVMALVMIGTKENLVDHAKGLE